MQAGPLIPQMEQGGSCPLGAHSPVRVTDPQQPRAMQQSLCSVIQGPWVFRRELGAQKRAQLTLLGVGVRESVTEESAGTGP